MGDISILSPLREYCGKHREMRIERARLDNVDDERGTALAINFGT